MASAQGSELMYAIVLFGFMVAIIGYGTLMQRVFHGEARDIDIAYSATLGVAALIVIGGLLNAIGVAYGPAIDGVLLVGLALASWAGAQVACSAEGREWFAGACRHPLREPGTWVVGLCFAFTAYYLAPTAGYNPHDDLTQYLTRPYLMMRFGSVGANWFDSTGADSLGAQSWLLAFLLRYLPIEYANALDAAVLLSLSCALLLALGMRLGTPSWLTTAAIVLFLMLNPSQVNVSAIYSLTLMVAGLSMALLRTVETYLASAGKSRRWLAGLVPAAVFLAALPALKATAAPFAVLFSITFAYIAATWTPTWREAVSALAVMAATGTVVLALWAAAFLPQYRASLVASREWPAGSTVEPQCRYIYDCWTYAWNRSEFFNWFSVKPVQFGQIGLSITLCCVIVLVALLGCRMAGGRNNALLLKTRFSFSAIGVAALIFFLVAPALSPWGYLRYSSPMIHLAAGLAMLFGGAAIWKRAGRGEALLGTRWSWGAALLAPMLAIAVVMAGDFKERLRLATEQHTSLRIQTNVSPLLLPGHRDKMLALQARIPPGSTILAAVITPSQLDEKRNSIIPVFYAAFSTPWWGDLSSANSDDMRRILARRGIDYVIWQHAGEWVLSEQAMLENATNRIWVIGGAARNYLPLYFAVKRGKVGPIVYRDAEYILSRVVESYDHEAPEFLYSLGTLVDFAAGADYAPFIGSGWSFREASGMWSDGPAAMLRFDLDRRPEQPLTLEAQFSAFVAAQHPTVKIDVEVNGRAVASWRTEGPVATFCATIPPVDVPERTIAINFRIDGPPPPAELGVSSDRRNLGILLKQARLSVGADPQRPCGSDR
jgi:signal transduction histidine kinase